MTQPELNGTSDPLKPRTAGGIEEFASPPAYFGEALEDAELLLKYAAETGVDVGDNVRDAILGARAAGTARWNEEIAANLLAALTRLAARLEPVTARSLRACSDETLHTVRNYWLVAVCLAIFIVPFSIASFVTSAISTALRADIASANDLAVKLRAQLGPPSPTALSAALAAPTTDKETPPPPTPVAPSPPPGNSINVQGKSAPISSIAPGSQLPKGVSDVEVITELQQFASSVRAIDAGARQLNKFVFAAERDPYKQVRTNPILLHSTFQLPPGLTDYSEATAKETYLYQNVRFFAQSLLDDVSIYYGAITTCLLPVLYALLGACAYLLRSFEEQMGTRTFTPSHANSARFVIAAIGGAVVGLFNNFTITQGASISPLAIAFLVGYAVDIFFSFLEGLLQSFTKPRSSAGPPALRPSLGG